MSIKTENSGKKAVFQAIPIEFGNILRYNLDISKVI